MTRQRLQGLLLGLVVCLALPLGAVETPQVTGVPLLLNAATDETPGRIIGPETMARCARGVIYLDWASGVTAGAVQLESLHAASLAAAAAYTGTWAPYGSATSASGTGPYQTSVHFTETFEYLRTRVSTAVSGGAAPGVSSYLTCN